MSGDEVELLAEGLRFPEGPVWMDDGSVVLVEIARGTLTRVDAEGAVDVVAECGGGPNGAAVGPDGRFYVCNNGGFDWHESGGRILPGEQAADYAGGSVQRVDITTGEVETLYTHVEGHSLKGPNDLVFDETGGFWFTDHGKMRARERDRGGVYYARADGSEVREVLFPLDAPNGIGLSPDLRTLYVAETHQGRVFSWELSGPGEIEGYFGPGHRGRCLVGVPGHQLFDSLAVDSAGNVCVATIVNGGISIVSPTGGVEHVPCDDPITTNICFGGDGLTTAFITLSSSGRLISQPWARPGLGLEY
ncbi:MAG: SMP-30/gluconolactonase/LRE family protein [Actinomycetia bacterium]|nr:SMP-30/gluconolactonase/LRE family protein [Actinomycetes bacterium]